MKDLTIPIQSTDHVVWKLHQEMLFHNIGGIFENLKKEEQRDRNKTIYSTKGVKVFKTQKEDGRIIPIPHRFAVKPPQWWTGSCNPLIPGKWYVHVYQTKIETTPNIFRSLRSRAMAQHLKRICGSDYIFKLSPPATHESWKLCSKKPTPPTIHQQHFPNPTSLPC